MNLFDTYTCLLNTSFLLENICVSKIREIDRSKKRETLSLSLKMITISKEEDACIFYCQEYTKLNAEKYLKRLEEMEEVDICYMTNPRHPILQCTNRIYGTLDEYRLYLSNNEEEEMEASKNTAFGD